MYAALSVVDGSAFVDTNGDGDTDAGEVVVYRLGVQNVGTVTIGSIALTVDPSNGVVCAPDLPHTLAPGLSFQCEANYTVSRRSCSTPCGARVQMQSGEVFFSLHGSQRICGTVICLAIGSRIVLLFCNYKHYRRFIIPSDLCSPRSLHLSTTR